jgi:hypothetical protein
MPHLPGSGERARWDLVRLIMPSKVRRLERSLSLLRCGTHFRENLIKNIRVFQQLEIIHDMPIIFPGRPSLPKNSGLALRALPRLKSNEDRPSMPIIGLEPSTCMAIATLLEVMPSKPTASRCHLLIILES